MRLGHVVLACLALAATGCSGSSDAPRADTSTAPSSTSPAAPTTGTTVEPTGESVDIGGRSLYLTCAGTGSPTVILESGLTGDHRTWETAMPPVSADARTCTYDRANIGQSDPAKKPRTAAQMVEDLHSLLVASDEGGPYVLVGFSFGGLLTQLYAGTFPDDVAGMVLVDANSADELDQFDAKLTPAQVTENREFMASNPEGADLVSSYDETKAAAPRIPDVPLVVVTSDMPIQDWGPGWDPDVFNRLRAAQQKALTQLVSHGTQVITHSGHEVPSEDPEVIVNAIETVLGAAR